MPLPILPDGGARVLAYVGATAAPDDATFAAEKYLEAHALVVQLLLAADGTDLFDKLPEHVQTDVLPQQVLEVASKLWLRRNAPNGQMQYDMGGTTVLAPLDPLVTVRPLLEPFLPGGFA
ncbi:hypothetical protein [Promicromonospora sp. NPDC050262]|uniref:hypothetical protein n=1 Tax=Promicromonospora sp. NPDC050262 TaxID=3155036 RepID=UPI0033EE6EEF